MGKRVVKGLTTYLILFLFLSIVVHFPQWIDNPLGHIKSLPSSSLGVWHPVVITLIIYLALSLLKAVVNFIKNLITNKGKQS